MARSLGYARYIELIKRAEAHYERQGFVKWADLATELGVSRQRVMQMLQSAVGHDLITGKDLDRYRSPSSRSKLSRANEALRREIDKQRIKLALLPDNYAWLESAMQASPQGTTRSDLINAAITHYRKHIDA